MIPSQNVKAIALWMLEELDRVKFLYQEVVVYQIQDKFGDDYVYYNDNGNLAISQKVLTAFRTVSGEKIVWSRSERFWRFRESYDLPGRQQD